MSFREVTLLQNQRVSCLRHLHVDGVKSAWWHVDLSEVPVSELPPVEGIDAEPDSYNCLSVSLDVDSILGDTLVTISPMVNEEPTAFGISARINRKGKFTYISEDLIEVHTPNPVVPVAPAHTVDAVCRVDPTSLKFDLDPDFSKSARKFDSFLELVSKGKRSLTRATSR